MRLAVDLDTLAILSWAGQSIASAVAKRRDRLAVEVRFVRGGIVQELPSGTTATLGVKASGSFSAGFLASATSFVKTGTGTSTVYTFDLNFNTTSIGTAFTANPEKILAAIELEWLSGTIRRSSRSLPLDIFNDYIRGDEGAPVDADPAYYTAAQIDAKPYGGMRVVSQSFSPLDLDGATSMEINIASLALTGSPAHVFPSIEQVILGEPASVSVVATTSTAVTVEVSAVLTGNFTIHLLIIP